MRLQILPKSIILGPNIAPSLLRSSARHSLAESRPWRSETILLKVSRRQWKVSNIMLIKRIFRHMTARSLFVRHPATWHLLGMPILDTETSSQTLDSLQVIIISSIREFSSLLKTCRHPNVLSSLILPSHASCSLALQVFRSFPLDSLNILNY